LNIFLTYQGQIDFKKFAMLFFAGENRYLHALCRNSSAYFLVYAILKVKANCGLEQQFWRLFLFCFLFLICHLLHCSYYLFRRFIIFATSATWEVFLRLFLLLGQDSAGSFSEHWLSAEERSSAKRALEISGAVVLGIAALLVISNAKWNFYPILGRNFPFLFYLKHFPLVHIDREHEFAHSPKHGVLIILFLIFDLFSFKTEF